MNFYIGVKYPLDLSSFIYVVKHIPRSDPVFRKITSQYVKDECTYLVWTVELVIIIEQPIFLINIKKKTYQNKLNVFFFFCGKLQEGQTIYNCFFSSNKLDALRRKKENKK